MNIIEYEDKYCEDVKDLLVELQAYLSSLDKRGILVLKDSYRDGYFNMAMEEIKQNGGKVFIAERDGKAVGVIFCKILQNGVEEELTMNCPKIGFISDLVVTKRERSRGIGKELMSRAEKYFLEKGCVYSQLELFAPNENAAALYDKLGFEKVFTYLCKKIKE